MNTYMILKALEPWLKQTRYSSDDIEDLIIKHAIAAAGIAFVGCFIPGLAQIVTALTSAGTIWHMYYDICQKMNVKISENLLKSLAAAVLANIVTQLGGVIILALIGEFLPGAGAIAGAAVLYAVTYLAGFLFLKILVDIFKTGKSPSELSKQDFASVAKDAAESTDCRTIFEEARKDGAKRIKA